MLPLSLYNDFPFWKNWLPSAPVSSLVLLLIHGILAFFLNVANFNAVKEGGPLMMNVAGNVKQVVMIILSVYLFNNKMKPIGVLGSIICILGSIWYSYGEGESCWSCVETTQQKRVVPHSDEESEQLLSKRSRVFAVWLPHSRIRTDFVHFLFSKRRTRSALVLVTMSSIRSMLKKFDLNPSTEDSFKVRTLAGAFSRNV